MNHLHEMLAEDEILLCGLVTVLGLLAGGIARLTWMAWRRWVPRVH